MSFISFLEDHLLSCQWKDSLGVECMGCGLQRSFIHMLKGEFTEAFYIYPAIYILIGMLIFFGLHAKFNFLKGDLILKWLLILNVVIILVSFIYKII
ncbi:MAG: DUF2752 domain-containing protein [Flavobacteriaceae bacterium]|nr:DUF2752 domain-containing protein [Flavobacteriaceae bacterium]